MSLRYDQVAELVKIIDASACDELVLETAELKLSIRRHGAGGPAPGAPQPAAQTGPTPTARTDGPTPAAAPPPKAAEPVRGGGGGHEVRSPMVGTFYRAPSPDAPPFVEVGSQVEPGQPLCVIEVMKLFTTIYSETSGAIRQIGAENGELVEYDHVLFVVE